MYFLEIINIKKSWLILTSLYNFSYFLDLPVSPDRSYNFTCYFICSSVHPSIPSFILLLVKSFSQNWLISFFPIFLYEVKGLQMLKSEGAQFLWKILFCGKFIKKNQKIKYFVFLKMFSFAFPQNNAK